MRAEILALRDWVWSTYPDEPVLGKPNDQEGQICEPDDDADQDE